MISEGKRVAVGVTAKWEKTGVNEGVLEVEIAPERVDEALDRAFKKVVKDAVVPGFRKGKVPRAVFEARFGVATLFDDALEQLIPEAYNTAIDELKLEPVDQPKVEVEQIDKHQPCKFKATVVVKPEVTLGEYKGLTAETQPQPVTEEQVEEEMHKMQEEFAELEPIEEGEAQTGDRVTVDLQGQIDGEPFEGGNVEDYQVEIGSGQLIPGLEEGMVGMHPGESREVPVTFPEDYYVKELAGKQATFQVTLHTIKRKRLEELNDEFARMFTDFDTLEEVRQDIRQRLEKEAAEKAKSDAENALIEQAVANASVEIPEAMIEHQIDHMVDDFNNQLAQQGLDLETYFRFSGQTPEGLREQFRSSAEQAVRADLVLEAIAEAEQLEPSEEELHDELVRVTEGLGDQQESFIEQLRKNEDFMQDVRHRLKIRKAIDFLVANSKRATDPV